MYNKVSNQLKQTGLLLKDTTTSDCFLKDGFVHNFVEFLYSSKYHHIKRIPILIYHSLVGQLTFSFASSFLVSNGAEKDEMTKRARRIGSSIHEEVEVEDPVMMTIIDIDLRAYTEIFFCKLDFQSIF